MNRSTTTLILSKESLKLLMLIMKTMLVITTSVPLILVTTATPVVLTVKTRRRSSATSTPRRLARRLWKPSILKSVRRESILFVRSHMREVITALVLLIITQRLWLLLITQDIMRVMEVITRILFLLFLVAS